MRRNFKITNIININTLNQNIGGFEYENRYKPYIFMNSSTITELCNTIDLPTVDIPSKSNGLCGTYMGIKVFCDNTLQFGEVELR